jgi:2-amino-4-hydroxy-6-hydroxymethyldihydropteridine diphosphokinase
MRIGYLGIGSNLGNRRGQMQAAVDTLGAYGVRVLDSSPVYDVDHPLGFRVQQAFLKAAVRIETELEPEELFDATLEIERELNHDRYDPRTPPRPIDIDVLLLGDVEHVSERLRIPHEQIVAKGFYVIPLLDIDFELTTPDGERMADWLPKLRIAEDYREAGGSLLVD